MQKFTKQVTTVLTPGQHKVLKALAKAQGITLAAALRSLIPKAA